jgi:hypothetical protein
MTSMGQPAAAKWRLGVQLPGRAADSIFAPSALDNHATDP